MKRTRFVLLWLAVLVVFVSLSGCSFASPAVTNNVDDVLLQARNVTKLADDYADDALRLAKQSQQFTDEASQATRTDDYLAQSAKADEAARRANEAAKKALSYKNQIDDPATLNKVDQASDEAALAFNRLRLYFYQANVDDISSRIIQENLIVDEGLEGLVKEVVTAAFCSTLADALVGPLPGNQEIKDAIHFRSILRDINLTDVEDIIAGAIHNETKTLIANLKTQEEVESYKNACEKLVGLF